MRTSTRGLKSTSGTLSDQTLIVRLFFSYIKAELYIKKKNSPNRSLRTYTHHHVVVQSWPPVYSMVQKQRKRRTSVCV